LPETELRELSRKQIEAVEFWLRRLIDDVLTEALGEDYYKHQNKNGDNIIKNEVREDVHRRIKNSSHSFSRWIDATTLGHLNYIVCKPKLFEDYFKSYFFLNFSLGHEQLRLRLNTIVEIRNLLSHSNPISIRQAEKVVCYTNDVIDSIKDEYKRRHEFMEFNVPSIISYSDSFGNKFYRKDMDIDASYLLVNLSKFPIRCGDRLKFIVEVDSTFDMNEYSINWDWPMISSHDENNTHEGVFSVEKTHVGEIALLTFTLSSNEEWHRYNFYDDKLIILLRVLPPMD
jgi:hypothetical protein